LQSAYQFFLKDNFKAGFKTLSHVAKLARKLAEEAEQKYNAEYKSPGSEKSALKMKDSVEERMTKQKHAEEKLQGITQKELDLMK